MLSCVQVVGVVVSTFVVDATTAPAGDSSLTRKVSFSPVSVDTQTLAVYVRPATDAFSTQLGLLMTPMLAVAAVPFCERRLNAPAKPPATRLVREAEV